MGDSALETCETSKIKYDLRTDEAKLLIDPVSLGIPKCSELEREQIKFHLGNEVRSISSVSIVGDFIVVQLLKTLAFKEKVLDELRMKIMMMLRHLKLNGYLGAGTTPILTT